MSSIRLENVFRRYDATVALAGVSLDVPSGEMLAVVGPSGSGKTTMLRLIAGLDEPSAGKVLVSGSDPAANAGTGATAMVFQNLALYPHLSVRENIALGLRLRKVGAAEIRDRVAESAQALSIAEILQRTPNELSGGERQRVALARALVKRPRVLLLDEPFSGLDWHLRSQLREELRRLHGQSGLTIVCVTHDLLEAISLGDRVAILNRGQIEQVDSVKEILACPASDFVESFVRPAAELFQLARSCAFGREQAALRSEA